MSKEPGAPTEFSLGAITQSDIPAVAPDHVTSSLPSSSFTCPSADECMESSAAGVEQVDKECEANPAEQRTSAEELVADSNSGTQTEEVEKAVACGRGRYEYMDIRRSDSTEGEDAAQRGSSESAKSAADAEMVEVHVKDQRVEEEHGKYHNTNKQAPYCEDVSGVVKARPDVFKAAGEKVEEYEEMTWSEATPSGWERANYQNLPAKVNAVSEEADGDRCAGIGDYIKVCAVVGSPDGNTSFDNPDYWHSRLFIKPDAVRT